MSEPSKIRPVIILPPEEMSESDINKLHENGFCVVVAKHPDQVRFMEPPLQSYPAPNKCQKLKRQGHETRLHMMKFLAMIQGGIGPDAWDREREINSVDFMDAAQQAQNYAEEHDGHVVSLDLYAIPLSCKHADARKFFEQLQEAVKANHEWHNQYDEYGGYPESDLCEQNCRAMSLIFPI
jgi:hypothetical protein